MSKRCCVPNCFPPKGTKHHKIPSFVGRPVQEWLPVINNPNVNETNYKKYVICSEHFEPNHFSVNQRLTYNSFPTRNLNLPPKLPTPPPVIPEKTIEPNSAETNLDLTTDDMSTKDLKNIILHTSEKNSSKILLKRIQTLSKRVKRLQREFKAYKKEHKPTPENVVKGLERYLEGNALLLCKMQVQHAVKYSVWNEEEKRFALSIHNRSPAAYTYLRKTLNILLPSYKALTHESRSEAKRKLLAEQCEILTEMLQFSEQS